MSALRTPIVIEGWLETAAPGERMEYFRGSLAQAMGDDGLTRRERMDLGGMAEFMRELAARGAVVLAQKRHGEDDYSYLAVKR